jgi:exodeoxyribonuclease VII large subunit
MDEQLDLRLSRHEAGAPLSVTQLVRKVRDALDSSLAECWVVGEISNARLAPSNHFYFTLKDERSAINVVMFNRAYQRVRFKAADGMEVLVRGRVSVFEARGALQLYAEEMEPRGVGALQVAFEQLKRRLEAEGLFDAARKRPLPFLPRTIGIVTARRGAGLRDIMTVLFGRFPNLHLIVRPAKVQGDGAAREIADALADLNRDGRAEVIIVGRGGGSLEDLWAFNEEPVARAIHRSAIPVISAVGHEVDYTIADFVADVRAPTPTAAAQMAVPSKAELRERIDSGAAAMTAALLRELSDARETVDGLGERLRHPAGAIRGARGEVAALAADLVSATARRIAHARSLARELALGLSAPDARIRELRHVAGGLALRLAHAMEARALAPRRRRLAEFAARLDSLSPLRVLERGYAVVLTARDGRAVLDAATVEIGDELNIRVMKGRLRARTIAREA